MSLFYPIREQIPFASLKRLSPVGGIPSFGHPASFNSIFDSQFTLFKTPLIPPGSSHFFPQFRSDNELEFNFVHIPETPSRILSGYSFFVLGSEFSLLSSQYDSGGAYAFNLFSSFELEAGIQDALAISIVIGGNTSTSNVFVPLLTIPLNNFPDGFINFKFFMPSNLIYSSLSVGFRFANLGLADVNLTHATVASILLQRSVDPIQHSDGIIL